MPATDRKKGEDRQLANALTASGYKTRKEKLREGLLKCIKRNPTNLPAACAEFHLEVQKARNFDDLWVLYSEYSMDDILVWARQIQEEENAKLRPKIVSSRRDADGAGPSNGASPVSRHPSAGPVRGIGSVPDLDAFRKSAVMLSDVAGESLHRRKFNGIELDDWYPEVLITFIDKEDVANNFGRRVCAVATPGRPIRESKIPEEDLKKMWDLARREVCG